MKRELLLQRLTRTVFFKSFDLKIHKDYYWDLLHENENAFLTLRSPTPHRRLNGVFKHFPGRSTRMWCPICPHCNGWQCFSFKSV